MTKHDIDWDDLRKPKIEDIADAHGVETEDRTRDELVEALEERGVSPTGEGPSEKTVLYAFRRAATPDDMGAQLDAAFDEYEVREEETGSGKDVIKLVVPAEAQTEDGGEDDE